MKLKRIAVLILVFALVLSMAACGNKREIRDTLTRFEDACRSLDLNAMLDYVDPKIAKPIQFGVALYGAVADSDVDETLDDLVQLVFGDEYESSEFLSTLAFIEPKVSRKGDSAKIECKVSFELSGENFTKDATISFVKRDDEWYISRISFLKN